MYSNTLADEAIAISNLSFSYSKQAQILARINLNIAVGDRIGVIGPNGAGKTTLFHLIFGLLTPDAGKIRVFGNQVNTGDFNPDLGLVFQNPSDQLFTASVWNDVAFGPQNMGLSALQVHQQVMDALSKTGTEHLMQRVPHHLSGGEKRMVAIASVLAMKPRLIIYDEPAANLDIRTRRCLIQFLQQSQETMLVSSHDLELILEVCDHLILLSGGQIVAEGPTAEVMSNQPLMEKYDLEIPHSLLPHHKTTIAAQNDFPPPILFSPSPVIANTLDQFKRRSPHKPAELNRFG